MGVIVRDMKSPASGNDGTVIKNQQAGETRALLTASCYDDVGVEICVSPRQNIRLKPIRSSMYVIQPHPNPA